MSSKPILISASMDTTIRFWDLGMKLVYVDLPKSKYLLLKYFEPKFMLTMLKLLMGAQTKSVIWQLYM